jgi:four helix bundle protein
LSVERSALNVERSAKAPGTHQKIFRSRRHFESREDFLMNVQRATFNAQRSSASRAYDLEDRLLEYAVRIIGVTESMKRTRAGVHIADQLLRSGTSPYGNHGEAEGAESRDDFLHKLRVCFKELRESRRWLKLIQRAELIDKPELVEGFTKESDELVRIFARSIQTAVKRPKEAELEC